MPLVWALGLDLLAVANFVIAQLLIFSRSPGPPSGSGFFADPLPAALMVVAGSCFVAGGVVAAVGLIRAPLKSARGRWAVRCSIFNILLLPGFGVAAGIASLVGIPMPNGWGEPFVPIWLGSGLAAIALALAASQERLRSVLVLPLLIGAAALTFWLGEVLSSH